MAEPVEDMTTLSELTEGAILENLKQRYERRLIYTYTGSILVAMNPFERLDIYTTALLKQYTSKRHSENPPHIFAVADAAYSNMRTGRQNQAVIISGESGAGKSESTKVILQFLTGVTSSLNQESWVEQQILEANTVLESFGNAKTVRNNNSSRFGKFIQVNFNRTSHIIGASIVNYLLEKSRIAKQAPSERNYHVFYELVQGASDDERAKYHLLAPEEYNYLNQSGCIEIPHVNDKKHFEGLKLALTVLNMSPTDQEGLFKTLAAILWIGNIKFVEDSNKESVKVADEEAVGKVAGLLAIESEDLKKALVAKRLVIRGETSMVPYKLTQALDNRDSIAKAIYDSLFQRLVEFINQSLTAKEKAANFVGVLDIFGFEVFAVNSFEQFCINYTNEKLQQFFNQFIFKLEQEEYDKENIKWDKISFQDNAQCLELIEGKPTGILSLLDEETRFPKGSDDSWLSKLDGANAKHAYYIKPKTQRGVFGIKHYAGDVMYTVSGFLEKNRDTIQEEIYDMVRASKTKFISKIFPPKEDANAAAASASATTKGGRPGGGGAKLTAGAYFRNQLVSLVTVLGSTTPHYVRCIKPNQEKEAFLFNDDMVLAQLRYSGMLDTIRIRKAGFPTRLPFDGFAKTFKCLIPGNLSIKSDSPQALATGICTTAQLAEGTWQTGKTKVFLKPEALERLQTQNDAFLKAKVLVIQKVMLGYMYRQRYLRKRKVVVVLQRHARGFIARRRYKKSKRAIVKIQAAIRGWFARDYYRSLLGEKRELERQEAEAKRAAELAAQKAASAKAAAEGTVFVPPPVPGPSREDAQMIGFAMAVQKKKEAAVPHPPPPPPPAVGTSDAGPRPPPPAQPQTPVADAQFDNLFAFLGEFDPSKRVGTIRGADALAKMAAALTADIDAMFDDPSLAAPTVVEEVGKKIGVGAGGKAKAGAGGGRRPSVMGRRTSVLGRAASVLDGEEDEEGKGKGLRVPIIKKEKHGSNTSLENKKINFHAPEYQMDVYGEKHFETHHRPTSAFSTLTRKPKLTLEVHEMVVYTKHPIQLSLTKIPNKTEKLNTAAVESFKTLAKAMDPSYKKQEEAVQAFVANGIEMPDLRDELYVQVMKQVSAPKGTLPKNWDQMVVAGWLVLALCAASFPPSKVLSKFLQAFIARTIEQHVLNEKHPVRKLAQLAEEGRKQLLLNGARKLPPSLVEISAVKSGTAIPCRFSLLDGQDRDIPITSTTTAADIVREIAKGVDLKDPSGWSIYEVTLKYERALKASDYLVDVVASWERDKKSGAGSSTKKKDSAAPAFNVDANLVLKKRIFRNPHDPITDPVEYNLLYAQTVDSVAKDMFPISERVAMQMAALRAHVLLGDCDKDAAAARFGRELPEWVARRLIPNQPKETWIEGIIKEYQRLRGTKPTQAKVLYLESAKSFKHYGASLFPVRHKGFWAYNENILFAVSHEGIDFVHPKTKESILTFTYREVKNYEAEHGTLILTAVPLKEDLDFETTEIYQFVTEQADEIVSLIREYCPTTEYMKKAKETAASETDLGTLSRDLVKCRERLLEHGIVRRPGPESVGSRSTFKAATMTIRRIGTALGGRKPGTRAGLEGVSGNLVRSSSALRSSTVRGSQDMLGSKDGLEDGHGSDVTGSMDIPTIPGVQDAGDYTEADWSYSTKPLLTSLMSMADNELEDWATHTYNTILSFQGPAGGPIPDPAVHNVAGIQSIVQKCIDYPSLINELYLQLIKVTTNHPEPDSLRVLNLWKLFCVMTGALAPSGWVLEYAKAHLRNAVDTKAKKPRKEEAVYAKHCFRVLQKAAVVGARKCPPSVEEISFSTKMTPMRIRFHFLDGQFRAIPLEPTDTCQSVTATLLDRIKLRNLQGFCIYEQFVGQERAVNADEKISDLLYKWEKYAQEENLENERVRFVFKKRLFLDPMAACETELEETLVMAQAMAEIQADLYPMTEDEVVYITALDIQAKFGDSHPDKNLKYWELAEAHIPPRMLWAGIEIRVEEKHMELLGTTAAEANLEIMATVRSWPYYGATIFKIQQSYTNEIPSECLLAVTKDAVHIMERQSKEPLVTHPFDTIVSFSPSQHSLLLITDNMATGSKYVLSTSSAHQIASLIKDYIEVAKGENRLGGRESVHGSRGSLRGSVPN
ncbi:cytochrome c oxidase subunit 1, partial [Borealophlyctis nickersoniae]